MPNAFGWTNLNDGYSFDPANNTWTAISTVNAPPPRRGHSAVWTGTEMIVWSGVDNIFGSFLKSGAIYNPSTDTWRPMSAINSPSARNGHRSFWTGTKMIVWGGEESYQQQAPANTGGIYDLATDSWTLIQNSPMTGRLGMFAAWTGNEMVIWGGQNSSAWSVNYSDGARFNPTTGVWKMMDSLGAPSARSFGISENIAGTWTGKCLLFFGGSTNGNSAVGGTYLYNFNPETPTITSAVAANIKSSEATIGGMLLQTAELPSPNEVWFTLPRERTVIRLSAARA